MTKRETIIDGSQGEGGGQVLRTSLSLSAITGKPVRIQNVRGRRKKPGLFRQHLTAFKAAAEICGARMEGAKLRSPEIAFYPGDIESGDYSFSIGSAGATNLVAQTVLPILSFADGASTVSITGGTHNMWAPTFDFFDRTFLPQFRKLGGKASVELVTHGFYPAGGGEIRLAISPAGEPERLELIRRGKRLDTHIDIVLANLKRSIANRELKTLLNAFNLPPEAGEIHHVESPGPGNALSLFLEHEHVTEVITNLGQHGVRAESVAKQVAGQAKDYLQSEAAVGEHLADQLLLPMALLGGGVFTTTDVSQHTRTNIDIIRKFLDVTITTTRTARKCWTVEVQA